MLLVYEFYFYTNHILNNHLNKILTKGTNNLNFSYQTRFLFSIYHNNIFEYDFDKEQILKI